MSSSDELIKRDCIGCGYCCKTARCQVSFIEAGMNPVDPFDVIGEKPDCPYLYFDEKQDKYRCLIADKYKEELAIGEGCCSPMNTTRQNKLKG